MVTHVEVGVFLENFRALAKGKELFVLNRPQNVQGLLDLGITALVRKETILELQPTDYVAGPSPDKDFTSYYIWIFGTTSPLDSREIYIKLSDRFDSGCGALCISFHPSMYPLSYPLRMNHGPINRPLRN